MQYAGIPSKIVLIGKTGKHDDKAVDSEITGSQTDPYAWTDLGKYVGPNQNSLILQIFVLGIRRKN